MSVILARESRAVRAKGRGYPPHLCRGFDVWSDRIIETRVVLCSWRGHKNCFLYVTATPDTVKRNRVFVWEKMSKTFSVFYRFEVLLLRLRWPCDWSIPWAKCAKCTFFQALLLNTSMLLNLQKLRFSSGFLNWKCSGMGRVVGTVRCFLSKEEESEIHVLLKCKETQKTEGKFLERKHLHISEELAHKKVIWLQNFKKGEIFT